MATDVGKFIANLKLIHQRQIDAARRALDVFGEHVIGDAQQLTPVKTGFLQGSGTTEPAEIKGQEISKTLGFNASYAAAVHEKLNAHHEVGEAKFLEKAMASNAPKLAAFVANRVKAEGND